MEFSNKKEMGKVKVVPDHMTKAQRQSTGRAPVLVKHSIKRNFICQQLQCAPDLVWIFWRTGNLLSLPGMCVLTSC